MLRLLRRLLDLLCASAKSWRSCVRGNAMLRSPTSWGSVTARPPTTWVASCGNSECLRDLQLSLQFRADPTCSSRRSSRPPRRNTRVDLALYTVTPLRSLCHAWTGCSSVPVETEEKRLCPLSEAGHAIVILPSCSSSLLSLPPQLASRPHRSIHKTRTLDHRRPVRGSPQVLFCSMQVVSGNAVPTSRPASTRCTKP